jgi:hypothetical protein
MLKTLSAILISLGLLTAGAAEARGPSKRSAQTKLSKKAKKPAKKLRGDDEGLDGLPARGPERIAELKRRQAAKRAAQALKNRGRSCSGGICIEAVDPFKGPHGTAQKIDGLEDGTRRANQSGKKRPAKQRLKRPGR